MKNGEKILYVYIYCNLGGVTSVLKQRARHMSNYTLDGLFQIEYGGQEELYNYGFNRVLIAADLSQALKTELAENHYDVVTVIDMPDALKIVLDSDFRGKLIYEIHTSMTDALLKNDHAALSSVDHVVVPSAWSKNWVLRHFPILDADKVRTCGNIVDPELFQPAQVSTTQEADSIANHSMIWVGKFDGHKNWEQAIEIADRYLQNQSEATAYFVTGGRMTSQVMKKALAIFNDAENAERLLWLHNLTYAEMAKLYQRVAATGGVFLSSSDSESFCMVIHEASRCGLPIVTRSAGAIEEFIHDGESGLLFDPLQTQSAVDALELVVSDTNLRKKLMNGAEQMLKSYSPNKLIADYVSAIN